MKKEKEREEDKERAKKVMPYKQRMFMVFLIFVGMAIPYSDRINATTIVLHLRAKYEWSPNMEGAVLAAFYYGYVLVQFPASYIVFRFGGKEVLFLSMALWGLTTLLLPVVTENLTLLLILRVVLGIADGLAFPSVHYLIEKLIPPQEFSRVVAIVTSGTFAGTVVANYCSPYLSSSLGWQWNFYFMGLSSLAWCLWWHLSAVPSKMEVIRLGSQGNEDEEPLGDIPWRKIFRDKNVWAIIVNQFCDSWGFDVVATWLPLYFNDALKVPFEEEGILLSAPYLVQWIMSILVGYMADHALDVGYSAVNVRKFMQIFGMLSAGLLFPMVCVTKSPFQASLIFSVALGLNSCTLAGAYCFHLDFAGQYAATVFSIGNFAANITGILAVQTTGAIMSYYHNSWNAVFLLSAFSYLFGAVAWAFLADGRSVLGKKKNPNGSSKV